MFSLLYLRKGDCYKGFGGFYGICFGFWMLSLDVEGFIQPKRPVICFDVHLSEGEFIPFSYLSCCILHVFCNRFYSMQILFRAEAFVALESKESFIRFSYLLSCILRCTYNRFYSMQRLPWALASTKRHGCRLAILECRLFSWKQFLFNFFFSNVKWIGFPIIQFVNYWMLMLSYSIEMVFFSTKLYVV